MPCDKLLIVPFAILMLDGGVRRYDGFGYMERDFYRGAGGNFCALFGVDDFYHRLRLGPEAFRWVSENRKVTHLKFPFLIPNAQPLQLYVHRWADGSRGVDERVQEMAQPSLPRRSLRKPARTVLYAKEEALAKTCFCRMCDCISCQIIPSHPIPSHPIRPIPFFLGPCRLSVCLSVCLPVVCLSVCVM